MPPIHPGIMEKILRLPSRNLNMIILIPENKTQIDKSLKFVFIKSSAGYQAL